MTTWLSTCTLANVTDGNATNDSGQWHEARADITRIFPL